jgi:two-component sensor histidine kinase
VQRLISKWTDEFRRAWLNTSEPSLPLNVAFVIFCLGACTLFRWFITLIRPDTPFSIYFPAVLFAAAFGGLRGGIAATIGGGILGFTLAFLNEPPVASLLVLFLIYLTISGLIIWGIQHYRSLIAHQRQISSRLMEEEQYRKLVVNELQHRLKNKVTTVHAVLRQLLHLQPDVFERIDGCLNALSATDDLIAHTDERGCDLKELLLAELGPYGHVRFILNGEPVYLPGKLAVSLALIVHELATNAAKHGAFSSSTGYLQLSWTVSDNKLSIVWDETGGPTVQPPKQLGFGSKLIASALRPFGGETEVLYLVTGIYCTMKCKIPAS